MIKQKIDVKVFFAYADLILATDKGKALAEFEQELFQVAHQPGFQFPFVKIFFQRQKVLAPIEN